MQLGFKRITHKGYSDRPKSYTIHLFSKQYWLGLVIKQGPVPSNDWRNVTNSYGLRR